MTDFDKAQEILKNWEFGRIYALGTQLYCKISDHVHDYYNSDNNIFNITTGKVEHFSGMADELIEWYEQDYKIRWENAKPPDKN